MTRENLLKTIYDNTDDWSCQYPCPHVMEECNPQNVCMECANRLLTEYEQKIRVDAIDEAINKINEHRIGLKADYDNKDISEDTYGFRDDECLWIIEILEQLKE